MEEDPQGKNLTERKWKNWGKNVGLTLYIDLCFRWGFEGILRAFRTIYNIFCNTLNILCNTLCNILNLEYFINKTYGTKP